MIFSEIENLAKELARIKGAILIPGRYTETNAGEILRTYTETLYTEWINNSKPRLVQVSGTIDGAVSSYELPGYRSWVYVEAGGYTINAVPITSIYYNQLVDNVVECDGFNIDYDRIRFTGTTIEAGDTFKVVYYADPPGISGSAEPYIPRQLQLPLARELAWRVRIDFGGAELSRNEMMERTINEQKFKNDLSIRNSDRDTLPSPNVVDVMQP